MVASNYSIAEMREVVTQVESGFHDAGLRPVWVAPRYDGSGVDVEVERTEGRTDDALTVAAGEALAGLTALSRASLDKTELAGSTARKTPGCTSRSSARCSATTLASVLSG